jgi:hypothetical protein
VLERLGLFTEVDTQALASEPSPDFEHKRIPRSLVNDYCGNNLTAQHLAAGVRQSDCAHGCRPVAEIEQIESNKLVKLAGGSGVLNILKSRTQLQEPLGRDDRQRTALGFVCTNVG